MLIDTHCHLNFKQFNNDWRDIINRAFDENVWVVNVGADTATTKKAIEIAENYKEGVCATVGFHPIYVKDATMEVDDIIDMDFYLKAIKHPKVVAVGEIGLDYYHTKNDDLRELQKKVLRRQIEIAKEYSKPVIFHSREATDDMMEEARKFLPFPAVMHCFAGSWETAKQYLDMGFLLSFTGIITFNDNYNKVIKNTPLDKIMIETDAPYLTPIPYRGQRNEPSYVKYAAQKIADIKEISFKKVEEQTTKNARKFFGI
jgi:TatD DNase family protein